MRRLIPLFFLGLMLLWAPAQSQAVTMKTTTFVAEFEGFYSCPYNDPAGHATIGYGHLLHFGPVTKADRKKWGCLSKKRALKLLKKDLLKYELEVTKRLKGTKYNGLMLQALTSFAFNLGPGYLDYVPKRGKRPATNISRRIKLGRHWKAAREILYFDGAIIGGKRVVLPGLTKRRKDEYKIMAQGIRRLKCGDTCSASSADGTGGGIGVN